MLEIANEARLENRSHRPEPHGHGRKLPEVGHQPGMGIGGKSYTRRRGFLPEMPQLFFRQAPFEIGTRIDAGRGMALHEDHVTGMLLGWGTPEMVESHFIQSRGRGVARQVSAILR